MSIGPGLQPQSWILSHATERSTEPLPSCKESTVPKMESEPVSTEDFLLDLSSMPPERSPLEDGDFMNSPPACQFFFIVFLLLLLFNFLVFLVSFFIIFIINPGDFTLLFKTLFGCVGNRELLIDPPQSVERIKKNRSSERKTHQPTN